MLYITLQIYYYYIHKMSAIILHWCFDLTTILYLLRLSTPIVVVAEILYNVRNRIFDLWIP